MSKRGEKDPTWKESPSPGLGLEKAEGGVTPRPKGEGK